jgi:hypothetical protein
MTSLNGAPGRGGGTRVAGVGSSVGLRVGSSVGLRVGSSVGVEALELGRVRPVARWAGQGCGACQRSSTHRRRVPHLPPTVAGGRQLAGVPVKRDRGRRPNSPAGWCRLRRPPDPAADEPSRPITLDSGASLLQLHHRSPGDPGGQQAGGRHSTLVGRQAMAVRVLLSLERISGGRGRASAVTAARPAPPATAHTTDAARTALASRPPRPPPPARAQALPAARPAGRDPRRPGCC